MSIEQETATATAATAEVTEQTNSEESKKELPSTPQSKKDASEGFIPKLKRNLTKRSSQKPNATEIKKEETPVANEGEGANATAEAEVEANAGENLATPTKNAKRLSARANEILHDIRDAFKQPLVASESEKATLTAKETETKGNGEAEASVTATAENATSGEIAEASATVEAKPEEKTPTKNGKRLSIRANELLHDIRGAFKQPLVSPIGKKEATKETTIVEASATEGEAQAEAIATEAPNSPGANRASVFGGWLNVFGNSTEASASTEKEQTTENAGDTATAEASTSAEQIEAKSKAAAKDKSIMAALHNLVKDKRETVTETKTKEEEETKEKVELKVKQPFWKRRKSGQKEEKITVEEEDKTTTTKEEETKKEETTEATAEASGSSSDPSKEEAKK